MLTIFTPAYNRRNELQRLYASLVAQTNQDFEWLVIDDGSVDDTVSVMEGFMRESKIRIRFFSQENGGKMRAHNRGVERAEGELFVCIDSDDWLEPHAVSQILQDAPLIEDDNVAGMMYLCLQGETNEVIGTVFPWDHQYCSYFDVYHQHHVTGDKTIVYKTSVMREFLFPEIDGEKFVPEALIYNRISEKYVLLCVNVPAARKEYLEDGYTNNYFNLCKKNPKAQILYYKELYRKERTLYNVAAYNLYCIYGKVRFKDMVRNHPIRFWSFVMYLPAYVKYLLKERHA